MLVYSTYLGATGYDYAWAIAVDLNGFAYVTGQAWSGFPTTSGAYDTNFNGGGSYGPDPDSDVFVTKLNPRKHARLLDIHWRQPERGGPGDRSGWRWAGLRNRLDHVRRLSDDKRCL